MFESNNYIGTVIADDEQVSPTSYSHHKFLTKNDVTVSNTSIEFAIGEHEHGYISFSTDEYTNPIDEFSFYKFSSFYNDIHHGK